MKKKFLAAVVAATAAIGLSACGGDDEPKDDTPVEEPSGDSQGSQNGGTTEEKSFTVTFNSKDGSSVSNATVKENGKVTKPSDPTKEGFVFGGWYTDEACTSAFDFNTAITGNITLYAKWTEETYTPDGFDPAPEGYEYVNYDFFPGVHGGTADIVYSEDTAYGNYTVLKDTTLRVRKDSYSNAETEESKTFTHSVKLNGSKAGLKVNAPGDGKLWLYVKNGSGGATVTQTLAYKLNGEDKTLSYPVGSVQKIEIEVKAGDEFVFQCTAGTSDVYEANMICLVQKSEVVGFEIVSKGTTQYLEGQAYDSSKVSLNAVYGNGRREVIDASDMKFDTTAYNANAAGTYDVKVSYGDFDAQTISVEVFEISSLELGFNRIEKLSSGTKYGNGQYFNKTVKQTYLLNQDFDSANIVVTAVCVDGEDNEVKFDLSNSDIISYDLTNFDKTTAGTYEVAVKYQAISKTVSESFKVYVVNTEPAVTDGKVNIYINPSYTGVVGTVENINGVNSNVFTTIQSALDYLAAKNIAGDTEKVITLASGTYKEKLEVTLPYVTMVSETGNADDVLIEWDSLYGLKDEGGFTHTTDSTQTVAVRDSAQGFKAVGITFSNYWNSVERFDEAFGAGYGEHRALAMLIQADQVIIEDCSLLGYQDTLELFTGRQLFTNCYIAGTTDFIFGTNNTTYFDGCTIHSIDSGNANGGYITAFKGNNKGAEDYVTYGAIFDGCNFTADEEVSENKTAIARPWGAYSAVAVINSELGAHISTTGYSGTAQNERYVKMNAEPTASTVKYVEYNNTGAGAITEAVAGMRFLTDAEALNYSDYSVIFAATNGAVSYTKAWDPEAGIVADPNTYYDFVNDGTAVSPTGTVYQYNGDAISGEYTIGAITINGTCADNRQNSLQCQTGTTLTFDVKAGTSVTVEVYTTYYGYTINGVAAGADIFSKYFAEDTTVVIEATTTFYIKTITINPEAENPGEATLESVDITGADTMFNVGDTFATGELVLTGNYSDKSIKVFTTSEYVVDSSEVDLTTPGKYNVKITIGSFETSYEVTVYPEGVDPTVISEDTTISFGLSGNYKDANMTVELNSSNTAIRDNGGNNSQIFKDTLISFKVKAGATILISSFASHTNYQLYTSYNYESDDQTGTSFQYTVTEDCTVNIKSLNNDNYLYSINIIYPVELHLIDQDTTIEFKTGGNYTDTTLTGKYWSCGEEKDSTCKITGDVILKVLEGAKVHVVGYTALTGYSQYGIYTTDKYGNTETTIATGIIGEYTYVATTDCVVIIRSEISQNYFNQINITYSDATLESYEVTGYAETLYIGNEFSVGDMVVTGTYSDGSTANLTYTVDSSNVDMTTAGTYTVTVNVTGFDTPFTYEVTVAEDNDPTIYYYFNGGTNDSGTVYTFASGTTHQGNSTGIGTFGDIAIDATAGKLVGRSGDAQINAGTKLTFDVAANSLVTVKVHAAESCTLNGIASTQAEFSVYYAEATTVEYVQKTNSYIYYIIISQPETAPTAGTLESLRVTDANTEFRVGDEYEIGEIDVKAIYSDKLLKTLSSEDYTIDTSAVDMTTAGEYEVVVTYNGVTASYTVVVKDGQPLFTDGTIYESTVISFGSDGNYSDYITEIGANIRDNAATNTQISAGSISIKVIAGSTITVDAYDGVCSYNVYVNEELANVETLTADTTFTVSEDAVVRLETVNANNYYCAINVVCPIAIAETTAIQFGTDANYKKYLTYSEGASYNDQSGQTQVASGSLSFYALAGAIIKIDAFGGTHSNYDVLVNGVKLNSETLVDDYTFTLTENSIISIAAAATDNYYKNLTVTYPVIISETTKIQFGTAGNYADYIILEDGATVGGTNSSDSQVKGSISFYVVSGATINIDSYGDVYASYNVYVNGTMINSETLVDDYTLTVDEDAIITLESVTNEKGNYYKSVTVTYPSV